ncbi:uncharacterized protein LOC132546979 [Ylistrum balloti]|uniref:uncharacterized protein LOC132546979 n=1 Tax=Ylistrum balloti TaxID=509963 RepID=UPI00290594FE|nr:uncharacterized protein LOC132546979 [Ylistrum balloti]
MYLATVMMKAILFFALCNVISVSDGFLFSRYNTPEWNSLRVTWSPFPIGPYAFTSMPRTTYDAFNEGYNKISGCEDMNSFKGNRFVKGRDYSVVLLYGVNGYIAGIQIGVPHVDGAEFPPAKQVNQTFVQVGDMYFLTAYFTNPATICSNGRTAENFAANGTGNTLYIQNGTNPVANSLEIPMNESGLASTKWTRGHCFFSMGVHYWYDVESDMPCDDFFPVFLLYNRGRLNAFGWAIGMDMTSPRMEHPPHDVIQTFMNPVPQCLLNIPRLSTMHIYMANPLLNFC